MRAYQLPKSGAGIDALVKVERPDPKPAYRQVVVKVKACSLNFRDLGIVRGTYRMPVRENLIPLSDGAGEVIEVGPRVTRVKVGDRVAGCFFRRSVPITASTTRPRQIGRRLRSDLLAAVALITLSRSAVPRRLPVRSAPST